MPNLISRLKRLFRPDPEKALDPDDLRQAFRRKYGNFRTLLTANNNALQAMAELEKLYYGEASYRMAHVHPKITTILVNVYKMIRNLLAMSEGRYADLDRIFERISNDLETIVEAKPQYRIGPAIIPLSEISREDRDLVGDKMANLGEAGRISGLNIPPGFVVTATATRSFLTPELITEINRQLQVLNLEDLDALYNGCASMQRLVTGASLPPDLEELLLMHCSRLEKQIVGPCTFALRSSALGEDSAGVSFAGLYKTVLHVERNSLVDAYKEVVASKYGARAIAYRRQRGYRHEDIEMCVGCLVMIEPLISGVLYSKDPTEEDSSLIRINATVGIGKGVVDGTRTTDLYLVGREEPHPVVFSELRQKQVSNLQDGDGGSTAMTYSQIKKLAQSAMLLEKHFATPQDIEWAIDQQGKLYILQSRPLQLKVKVRETANSEQAGSQAKADPPLIFGGITAAGGICSAPVHRIESPEDIRKFPQQAILVVTYPLPDWAPLLNRASGVIAEHGSEAGHLATVAREFGIPALFNVSGAMNKLADGQLITLSADSRAIYEGKRDDLLKQKRIRKNIMTGSPVQRILSEALQHITPLNLDDPNSPKFKSGWCETLHDITRFCHEKSIAEMFNFGNQHHFSQAAAKRLVGDVPLEWWVIDLADGLRPEIDEKCKTIRIEDIVSSPMLAIWQGISAFDWQGPPPVSFRGFGSIIFQSAMRPELDPAVASRLAAKNYFLISANFCNLSIRLGYHFAMIEAYLSDLLTESYVTFRFKGGAADLRRKAVRARLLADILQHYGFKIELRSDALLARIKKQSQSYLEDRLRILGYLSLHARQLDMVMNQPETVQLYKAKFLKEIEEMRNMCNNKTEQKDGLEEQNPAG